VWSGDVRPRGEGRTEWTEQPSGPWEPAELLTDPIVSIGVGLAAVAMLVRLVVFVVGVLRARVRAKRALTKPAAAPTRAT
jgi:hypothetical protein